MLHWPLEKSIRTTAKHLKKLQSLGIFTGLDLLEWFPRALESTEVGAGVKDITLGEKNTLEGTLQNFRKERTRGGKYLGKADFVLDDGAHLDVVWFRIPYQLKNLDLPRRCFLIGRIDRKYGKIQLSNPELHLEAGVHVGGIRPIYPESPPLTSKWYREKIAGLLSLAKEVTDPLPEKIIETENLLPKATAIKNMHFPGSSEDWQAARHRLGFEEIFMIQLRVLQAKARREQHHENPHVVPFDAEVIKTDLTKLPFTLTNHQKQALLETLQDFTKDRPMHRLLQGDVGSGKTIVGLLAALQAVRAGYQVAILAPTEILAQQHFQSALDFFERFIEPSLSPSQREGNRLSYEKREMIKQLRDQQTPAEEILWECLRDKRFQGLKWRRQHHIKGFLVDFYCHTKRLVIELDGAPHGTKEGKAYDAERTAVLEESGAQVIRFWNNEVIDDVEGVLDKISEFINNKVPSLGGIEGGLFGLEARHFCELLTGSKTTKQKKNIKDRLKNGEIKVLIGTHAILTEDTIFEDLGLAIIDEQHRFGVEQRSVLAENQAHVMAMTATPIPRSLALTIYGDQDLSIIREKPAGRKDIITRIVADTKTTELCNRFIEDQIGKGRQVFWVCPLVDESDKIEAKNVHDEYVRISETVFPNRRVGFLHGKMRPKEKDAVMQQFKNHEFDILVSTSVIEVGVDIPNATVMVIENAERFGLAQLHQFRGRIGRNDMQSYCFLMVGNPEDKSKDRLQAMEKSNDGFYLSEVDLKLRGAGEVYGLRQSGLPDLKCADLNDVELMQQARQWAQQIIDEDMELGPYPALKKAVEAGEVWF